MLKKVYDQGLQHGEEKSITGLILSAIGLMCHDSRSFHEPDELVPSTPQRGQTQMIDMTSPGVWQRILVRIDLSVKAGRAAMRDELR